MSHKSMTLMVCIAIAVSSVWFGLSHGADEPKAAPAADGQFAGKVLIVTSKSSTELATQLENPQLKRLGGEPYLVGTSFDDGDEAAWSNGRTVWIPMGDISQIVEFADRADLKKADEKLKPTEKSALSGIRALR